MKLGGGEEVWLMIADDMVCSTSKCLCRICHEEEEESSTTMESPCACSGTLKFAHRDCIQRWCGEKGNTVCEICLQNFEPDYFVLPQKALIDVPVTIRGSLEVPRINYGSENHPAEGDEEVDYAECSAAAERNYSWWRLVAFMFTVFLLVRHLLALISAGVGQYGLTLITVFALRAGGIIVPIYLVLRIISGIQKSQLQQGRRLLGADDPSRSEIEEENTDGLRQHVIRIHS